MKLLFAEDEVELSRAVCAILRHQGNEVDPAYDGEEALRKARAGSYDCMVMDVMMPRQDGISVVRCGSCSPGFAAWHGARGIRKSAFRRAM